ncbi:MAG: hypothetical protein J6V54_10305 [Bacteroidales bacterium]|nr:hypothetical protein [Bacteroidales bacterium]
MNKRNKISTLIAACIIAVAGTLPGCNNKKSESDNKVEVNLNEYFLEENKELQELLYSFNKDYATAVADNMNKFDTLIAKYGYSFSSKEAVTEYNAIVEQEEEYLDKFTAEELAQIEELQIKQVMEKENNL